MEAHKPYRSPDTPLSQSEIEQERRHRWFKAPQGKINGTCTVCGFEHLVTRRHNGEMYCKKHFP